MAKITKASLSNKKSYSIDGKEIIYFSTEEFKIFAGIAKFRVVENIKTKAMSCKAYKTLADAEADELAFENQTGEKSRALFNFKCNQSIDLTKPVSICMQKGDLLDACLVQSKEQAPSKTVASF